MMRARRETGAPPMGMPRPSAPAGFGGPPPAEKAKKEAALESAESADAHVAHTIVTRAFDEGRGGAAEAPAEAPGAAPQAAPTQASVSAVTPERLPTKTKRGLTFWSLWALIVMVVLALAVALGWLIFR